MSHRQPHRALTHICTDSQSLLKAIERRSPLTHYLRSLLNARPGPTTLLWKLGHKGIPGNELADTAAKTAASTTSDPPRPISHASERYIIRRTLIDPLPAPASRPHSIAESLRQSLRRPPVSPLQRGAADNRTLATKVPNAGCNQKEHLWKSFSTHQGSYHRP